MLCLNGCARSRVVVDAAAWEGDDMNCVALVVFAVLAAGCWAEAEDNAEVCVVPPGVSAANDGAPPGPFEFAEGEHVVVYALFNDTKEVRERSCSITAEGERLVIHTSYEYKRGGLGSAGLVHHSHALCLSEPLVAGSYTLEFDGRERELTIPSLAEAPCFYYGDL